MFQRQGNIRELAKFDRFRPKANTYLEILKIGL